MIKDIRGDFFLSILISCDFTGNNRTASNFTLEETFPGQQSDACSGDERLLPVGIGRHSALDDDDLPRVQASWYGPCVWDRLGGTIKC